jgi:tRNA-dihydrouridine synthase
MSVTIKFKKDLQTLKSAVNGDFYLDVKSPKLYKKIRRYYQNEGVMFSEDALDNYDILECIECIAQDLETSEVA